MPSILGRFYKQPNEKLDYTVDYSDWFANRSDTAASHSVIVPTGITKESDSRAGNLVRVVLSGGTNGEKYKITVLMTTSAGLIKEADFVVFVKEI